MAARPEPLYLMERLPEGESFILDYNRKTTKDLYRRGRYVCPKTKLEERIWHPDKPEPERGWDFSVNRAGYITVEASSGKMLGKSMSLNIIFQGSITSHVPLCRIADFEVLLPVNGGFISFIYEFYELYLTATFISQVRCTTVNFSDHVSS